MRRLVVTATLAMASAPLAGQQPGIEILAYPAGVISAARVAFPLPGEWSIEIVGGVNVTDRRDWGVHSNETGWGPGGGAGVRRGRGGLVVAARLELWVLQIDWRDEEFPGRAGRTDVQVFQPTVRGGWTWAAGGWQLALLLGLGREVNLRTRGEPVGEGWIALAGVALEWRR